MRVCHFKRTKYIPVTFVLSVTVISADFSDLVTLVALVMLYCGMNVYCNPAYGCQTTINVCMYIESCEDKHHA